MTAVFITVYRQRPLSKINEERLAQGQIMGETCNIWEDTVMTVFNGA